MSGLFSCQAFIGAPTFGPSRLDPSSEPPVVHRIEAPSLDGLRAQVWQECPQRPGVYGMLDGRGEWIYIGKAKCLRSRLLSYFRRRSRDPKAGRILACSQAIAWEHVPSEFAALLRELELIRRWRPRFNVQGQPGCRLQTYVCLGRRPAPYVFLAPRPSANVLACFGPVPAGGRAREAVRRLNDGFGLRDCPQAQVMRFTDQRELFPGLRAAGCLRVEIGTCLGPCAGACSRAEYLRRVRAARSFLEGTDLSLLAALERQMTASSAILAFEEAAILRDKLEALRWLQDQLERLRQARLRQSFVYPVAGYGGQDLWYFIHHGRVAAVLPAPRDPVSWRAAAFVLQEVYRPDHTAIGPLRADELDAVLLVAAWFRRHPQEADRTLKPAQALAAWRK